MAGNVITLPLRVSFRSARFLTRVVGGTTGHALSLVGRTIGAVAPAPPTPRATAPTTPPAQPAQPAARTQKLPETPSVQKAPPRQTPPPQTPHTPPPPSPSIAAEQTPVHVSEEPELVREVAEPGAEDGAGATIRVAEPWNGYRRMNAKDVVDRARSANQTELAAVRLYESRHRSRQTVLAAVDRQLKLTNGSGPA
jgi:hypothetical protein